MQSPLPRKCKAPRRYEVGDGTAVTPSSPEDHFKVIYYEALDTVIGCISDRFKQENYQMYSNLEQLLTTEEQPNEEDIDAVLKLYGSDFEKDKLITQLHLFHANYPSEKRTCIHDTIAVVKGMLVGEKQLLSEVVKFVKLLLVMLATNAISKRSFSAMHRIKTYLRSTMMQERLNSVMVLHVHKELTDGLNLKSICKEFVSKSD